METRVDLQWSVLIDDVLLSRITNYALAALDRVDTAFLAGSYVRGAWNRARPNVNVYLIAMPNRSAQVRLDLAGVFVAIRNELRGSGVDLAIDCHPYTISQRDPEWTSHPLLTLTSKVLAGEAADLRYSVSPTIGLGWYAGHRVLAGRADALDVFGVPPRRDAAWLLGVYEALSHYRNVLDHLPWALHRDTEAPRLLEESCRYAEEALRDGVHIGLNDDELAAGRNIEILRDWKLVGREFYAERYGERGLWACDTVERLKDRLGEPCTPADAESAWRDALEVWSVAWQQYLVLARDRGLAAELQQVTAWL